IRDCRVTGVQTCALPIFHEAWLGMVQPIEGLVVSLPVLVDAQCMERRGPEDQERFRELCPVHDLETGLELRDELEIKGRKKREKIGRGSCRETEEMQCEG